MTDNPCPPGFVWLGCHSCGGQPVCVEPGRYRHVSAPASPSAGPGVPWLVGSTRYPSYAEALAASLELRAAGAGYDAFRIRPTN